MIFFSTSFNYPMCVQLRYLTSFALLATGFMEGVEIPTWVLLEAMMKQMQLPPPVYLTSGTEGGHAIARAVFYPSAECYLNSLRPESLSSNPSDSTELAVEDAAVQAIRYMDTIQKKVIKDFRYAEMATIKKANEDLLEQVKQKDEKIKEKTHQLNDLARFSHDFLDAACDSNCRICKIITKNIAQGSNTVVPLHSGPLLDIETIGSGLKNLTFESTEELKAKVEDDHTFSSFSEDEYFTESSSLGVVHDTHSDSEVYNYDSDGRLLDYYGSKFDYDY